MAVGETSPVITSQAKNQTSHKNLVVVPSSVNNHTKVHSFPISFVEATKGAAQMISSTEAAMSSTSVVAPIDPDKVELLPISEFQGKPAILFPIERKSALVDKLEYVLVGKFSHGRPLWNNIKLFFQNLKLQGEFHVSISDYKHIFIEFSCKADFDKIWMNLSWSIDGYIMRVFKWSPDFTPLKESSIIPTWIRMVGLPLHLFDEMALLQISALFGKPIKIDPRNANRTLRNQARVCVQLDVAQPLIDSCWVGFSDVSGKIIDSYHVKVYYDSLSFYCSGCAHLGHKIEMCKRLITKEASKVDICKQDSNTSKVENTTTSVEKGRQRTGKEQLEVWQPVIRKTKASSPTELATTTNVHSYSKADQIISQNCFEALSAPQNSYVATSGKKEESKTDTNLSNKNRVAKIQENEATLAAIRTDNDDNSFMVDGKVDKDCKSKATVVWEGPSSVEQQFSASVDTEALISADSSNSRNIEVCVVNKKNDEDSQAIVLLANTDLEAGIEESNKQNNEAEGAILRRTEAPKNTPIYETETEQKMQANLKGTKQSWADDCATQAELDSTEATTSPDLGNSVKQTSVITRNEQQEYVDSLAMVVVEEYGQIETDLSAQEPQQFGQKNNKVTGVVTRSQMKATKSIWAEQVEEEQDQHTPIANKKKEEYQARQLNKTRRKEVTKLSNRINKIASRLKDKNLKDHTKRQLQADIEALKEEQSRLC